MKTNIFNFFGSSHSASSAYQKWPIWSTHSMSMLHSS
ncbi:unnamed protein product, partial [Onchocerca ochengi]|uniref:Uncharacterized protein n=1 Tax=Onchocerca ochengi TaxID=42157 RepID=A0A182EYQ5_ONCOC